MTMRLQTQAIEDKDALKDLQKALKNGTATQSLAQHSDARLLQFLTTYQLKQSLPWYFVVTAILLALFQASAALGRQFHLWSLPSYPLHLIFVPVLLFQRRRYKIDTKAWQSVFARLESTTLPTLLDIHGLKIATLAGPLRRVLTKQLSVATNDELDSLTPAQRKELVTFTLAQVYQEKRRYEFGPLLQLSYERNQAAIVGFLALATLKQSGAEHIQPETISQTHVNLRRAVAEYRTMQGLP